MKKTLILSAALAALCAGSGSVAAQDYDSPYMQAQQESSAQAAGGQFSQDPMMEQIHYLQTEWARIKYQIVDKEAQLNAIHQLEDHAAKVTAAYPERPEPKIWEGIILSTDAGIVKGMSALGKVKQARELFESSLQEDPYAMDGSAHTSLGSLYYQVPGWPIAFGDDEEAEKQLKQALQLNPNGIDPNYFYGDFLMRDDRYDEAKVYLERALQAPDRPGRELADAGRRQEIRAALAKLSRTGKNESKPQYN